MTSIFSLEGKRAAITGGADGIGFEMSSLFAQAGAQVKHLNRGQTFEYILFFCVTQMQIIGLYSGYQ